MRHLCLILTSIIVSYEVITGRIVSWIDLKPLVTVAMQDDAAIDRLINEFGEKDPSKQSYTEAFIKRAVKNGIKWLGPQLMVWSTLD